MSNFIQGRRVGDILIKFVPKAGSWCVTYWQGGQKQAWFSTVVEAREFRHKLETEENESKS